MMADFFLALAEPEILWTLFVSSILLVLLDYLLPVDWLAYLGYACFALFVAATTPAGPTSSISAAVVTFFGMLLLHKLYFSRFLTNAPHYEVQRGDVRRTSETARS